MSQEIHVYASDPAATKIRPRGLWAQYRTINTGPGQGRTGTVTALYRKVVQGWNPYDAIDEAHRFLVNGRQIAWLWDFANNHLNDSAFTGVRNAAGSN